MSENLDLVIHSKFQLQNILLWMPPRTRRLNNIHVQSNDKVLPYPHIFVHYKRWLPLVDRETRGFSQCHMFRHSHNQKQEIYMICSACVLLSSLTAFGDGSWISYTSPDSEEPHHMRIGRSVSRNVHQGPSCDLRVRISSLWSSNDIPTHLLIL